jgi:copper transport protein
MPVHSSAHAYIVNSNPAIGQTLKQSPSEVQILFSESIEPTFAYLKVTNESGIYVNDGVARIDPENQSILVVRLKSALPDGTYSATYRVISGDGHPVSGTIPFAISADGGGKAAIKSLSERGGNLPSLDQIVIRWLLYSGIMLFTGLLSSRLWIFPSDAREAVMKLLISRWLLVIAFLLTAIGVLLSLPLQVRIATASNWWSLWKLEWFEEVIRTSWFGTLWLVQSLLLVPLLALTLLLLYRKNGNDKGKAQNSISIWLVAVVVMGISTLKSGEGHPRSSYMHWLASTADLIHLISASVWIGGLLVLACVLPKAATLDSGRSLYFVVTQRFTYTGSFCAGFLLLSGIYGSLLYVPDWGLLLSTLYGIILLLKVLLVLVMLGLALISFLRARRHKPCGLTIWAEWGAGLVALILASFLTNISPEQPLLGQTKPDGLSHIEKVSQYGDTTIINITPGTVGTNHFNASVLDAKGQAAEVQQMSIKLTPLDMDMEPIEIILTSKDNLEKEDFITMDGRWQVDYHVLLKSLESFNGSFQLTISSSE